MSGYDCIVIGAAGGVGSAAMYFAAQRGWKVLGLDRFTPGHARGSSHGQTRIIRHAYFEHPNYSSLTRKSHQMWLDLEQKSNRTLLIPSGLIQIGNPDGEILKGVAESATQHRLPLQTMTPAEIVNHWPVLKVPEEQIGLYEKQAGILKVEECVVTFAIAAQELGAEFQKSVDVKNWGLDGKQVIVETNSGVYRGRQLIICPGPWAADLLGDLGREITVTRKHQHWFAVDDPRVQLDHGFPAYLIEANARCFYGFPRIDDSGIKVAEHTDHGDVVTDPLHVDRNLDHRDLNRIQGFLQSYFDLPQATHCGHAVCMYSLSRDEHFIVDTWPGAENVSLACGLSGHGFKFAPLLGRYLVELLDGHRQDEMEFLSLSRFNGALN